MEPHIITNDTIMELFKKTIFEGCSLNHIKKNLGAYGIDEKAKIITRIEKSWGQIGAIQLQTKLLKISLERARRYALAEKNHLVVIVFQRYLDDTHFKFQEYINFLSYYKK